MKQSILVLVVLLLIGCGQQPAENTLTPQDQTDSEANLLADTVYINGAIWTGVSGAKDAQVLAVRDGNIVFVGPNPPTNLQAVNTVDLDGKFMMHGFIDNHVHFFEGGFGLASVQLRDAATPQEFSQRIVDYANTLPAGDWVLNGNWDHELWGGELPDRAWIDAQTVNTPVFVMRLDGHMALANTAALTLAGITKETVSPEGGDIVRDSQGRPTGVLKDTAMNAVLAVIPQASEDRLVRAFENAQAHAFSLGLTKVHAMTAYANERNMFDWFQLALDREVMKMRVRVYTPIEYWADVVPSKQVSSTGSMVLEWAGVKSLVDGALGSATAWFHDPYTDAPNNSGFPLVDASQQRDLIAAAYGADLKLAMHAIGDKAIDNLIADLQTLPSQDISSERFRIEHFQHPTQAAIKQAAELGIIAAMHPYHAIDDGRWAEKRIGPERIKSTYAFRSILEAGGRLSFGSDWPVAPLSPMQGVYAAVTRRTIDNANPEGWQPQEKISVEDALRAYTVENAYAGFEEDVAGTLEVGKRADLVILSSDPRIIPSAELADVRAVETIVNGEQVYSGYSDN
jgi:predicted amidohydrolase YtcJ